MGKLIETLVGIDDVYEIQDLFEGLDDEVDPKELEEAVIPAIEKLFEFDCENETWAYVCGAIAGASMTYGTREHANECVERTLRMIQNQPDDTQISALLYLVDLAVRPEDEDGLSNKELAAPAVDVLLNSESDDSFTVREIGNLVFHHGLVDKEGLILIAKKLESLDLSVSDLCELAKHVHGDTEGMSGFWNIGDRDWALAILDKADGAASSKSENQDVASAREAIG